MFKPAALFIGLRYTRAKRRNHFISLISLVSVLGIALGTTVLITVLSVMNGFDQEIKNRVFSMVPPLTVSTYSGHLQSWQTLQKIVDDLPAVTGSAPFATGEVLLNYGSFVQAAMLKGVLPKNEKKVSKIGEKMVQGKLTNLQPQGFGIVLGENLAEAMQVNLGDKITVLTPKVVISPIGMYPQSKRFTVVGIFRAGNGFGFDRSLALIHLNDAQRLLGLGNQVSGLQLNIKNPFAASLVAKQLAAQLTESADIRTWADQFGEFFHAVELEKKMMFFILLLIIAVATFNLVSTLMMVVSEKESDIAILRTYGATPRTIMMIFIVQGGLIGILGTLLGLMGGLLLAFNATEIVRWIEHLFHVQFLSSSAFFVDYLPSKVQLSDLIIISLASLTLSLIATIYPAWRAAQLDPVESLRHE